MALHDPFLYAYMRSFNAPADYLNTYRRELGLQHSVPQRRRLGRSPHALVPGDRPVAEPADAYAWVTPKIRAMAATFSAKRVVPTVAEAIEEVRKAADARDNVFAATTDRKKRSGATRRYEWALAKHWYALTMHTERGEDPRHYIRDRVPSLLVLEARLARMGDARRYSKLAYRGRQGIAKAKEIEREWVLAREERHDAEREYDRARAAWVRARARADDAMAERRRVEGNWSLPAPAGARASVLEAQVAYKQALQRRHKAGAKYKEIKQKKRDLRGGNIDPR